MTNSLFGGASAGFSNPFAAVRTSDPGESSQWNLFLGDISNKLQLECL